MVGLFSMNANSIQGGLMMMVNMGLASTGLLFLTGVIYSRLGSSELSAMGGLARQVPRLAFFFFLFGVASIGLPGTSGFHGEFLTLMGAFLRHWEVAAIGVIGVILSAGYFLWYYERAFFGPISNRAVGGMRDLSRSETLVCSVVAALILAIGIYPTPVMNVSSASIAALVTRIEASNPATPIAQAGPAAPAAGLR